MPNDNKPIDVPPYTIKATLDNAPRDPFTPNKCGNVIFDSQGACSAATGYPMSVLRSAKKRGAPGFVGNNKIRWNDLEPWLLLHAEDVQEENNDTLTKWKTRKMKADAQLSEIELDEARKKYLKREDVEAEIRAIALAQKNILKAKLTQELPSRLLGMSVTDMSVEMDAVLNEVCKLMENLKLK